LHRKDRVNQKCPHRPRIWKEKRASTKKELLPNPLLLARRKKNEKRYRLHAHWQEKKIKRKLRSCRNKTTLMPPKSGKKKKIRGKSRRLPPPSHESERSTPALLPKKKNKEKKKKKESKKRKE